MAARVPGKARVAQKVMTAGGVRLDLAQREERQVIVGAAGKHFASIRDPSYDGNGSARSSGGFAGRRSSQTVEKPGQRAEDRGGEVHGTLAVCLVLR